MLKKFIAICEETYREALARKTIIGYFIISTLVILVVMFIFMNPTVKEQMMKVQQYGKKSPNMAADMIMVKALDIFWTVVLMMLNFVTICLGVFSTTGFITSQMEKGTIDLLISKPVPKWLYLLGRYLASLTIIGLQVTYFIIGIWVVVGATMGIWNIGFLGSIPFIVLGFAGIYSIVVLVSVLSGSSALSMIVGIGVYFISSIVAAGRGIAAMSGGESKSLLATIADVLYYILPQTGDMSENMKNLVVGNAITILPIFLIILLASSYFMLSIYFFNKKQF
ncbi:MAG: ABC transporter permease subunit [bacterium]